MAPTTRYLSGRCRVMLTALAGRMVPSSSTKDARYHEEFLRIVDDALGQRPARLRRQFELFVWAIRWAPVFRHGRRFDALDAQRQDALLAWLQDCPLALVRKGFWGLKALVFMGHYGQVDVAATLGFGTTR